MTDGELVRHTLAGRTSAYDPLVRKWAARVTAVCHARVGRPDVAEELAQEALFRGYKALGSLAEPEKFGPWLCGIAQVVLVAVPVGLVVTQAKEKFVEDSATPHSHPVLTIGTRPIVRTPFGVLTTYLHEQIHWYVADRPDATAAETKATRCRARRLAGGDSRSIPVDRSRWRPSRVATMAPR